MGSSPGQCHSLSCNNSGQIVHTRASVTKQYDLVLSKGWWWSMAWLVSAGVAENNDSVLFITKSPECWLPRQQNHLLSDHIEDWSAFTFSLHIICFLLIEVIVSDNDRLQLISCLFICLMISAAIGLHLTSLVLCLCAMKCSKILRVLLCGTRY